MDILSHDIYENIRTRTLVLHGDHILLLPAAGNASSDRSIVWRLPGGGLEPHESLAECAQREVLEECGIMVRVGRIAFVREWIVPRYAAAPDGGDGHGFGLEVFHYATPEPPVPEPRAERPGLIPPRWVPLGEVASLPLWPKELKDLCRLLAQGQAPAGCVSLLGRPESPFARCDVDPFAL